MKSFWLVVAGLCVALTGAAAFDAAAPQSTEIVVKPGQTLRIRLDVVDASAPPVDPPPTDPPPKPGKAPLALTVPADGSLADCCKRIAANGVITVRSGKHIEPATASIIQPGVIVTGESGAVIATPEGVDVVGAQISVAAPNVIIENIELRGAFDHSRRGIVGTQKATGLIIRKVKSHRFGMHCIQVDGDRTLIEDCDVRHNLQIIDGERKDAHDIVAEHANALVIRRCRLGTCSGDAFQAERGQWDEIVLEDCEIDADPLPEDMGGAKSGESHMENVVDTKTAGPKRHHLTIRRCRMRGVGRSPGKISHAAALNLKEAISGEIYDNVIEDCEVGIRCALYRDGMTFGGVTIRDNVIRGCSRAWRFEDLNGKPHKLYVHDNTFDGPIEFAELKDASKGWEAGLIAPGYFRDNRAVGNLEFSTELRFFKPVFLARMTDGQLLNENGEPVSELAIRVGTKTQTFHTADIRPLALNNTTVQEWE